MNFGLYIFGTPNGFSQYPLDMNSQIFQNLYQKQQTDTQLAIYRSERLVYYSFTRKLSKDISNKYFGVCLIFNGTYCRDPKKIYELFENSFSDIVLKGEMLQMDRSGKIFFTTEKMSNKQLEIERIKLLFQDKFENNFKKDFAPLSSLLKIGNGSKTLSINDSNTDILAAMQQFAFVYISVNEKSNSELDRIHKMLSNLYIEKQDLNTKYKKLLGQKKQYKVVIFLCVVVIGCILGLVIFNRNLQSKESKIQSLETELSEKRDTILSQRSNITQLQITQSRLNSDIYNLRNDISDLRETANKKDTIIDEKITEIKNLSYKDSSLSSENSSLKDTIRDLNNQNEKLSSEIANIKNSGAQKYRVIVSKSNCFRQCAGSYSDNNCYYSLGEIVDVYTQRNGYGLTIGGFIKMSDLQKY